MKGIHRHDDGASALEFAIVSLVLMTLLGGMLEFGFMFQAQLAVNHAAREGARLAAVDEWDSAIVAQRAYPLTTDNGLSIGKSGGGDGDDDVTVEVTYPWSGVIMSFGDPVTLSGRATMRME